MVVQIIKLKSDLPEKELMKRARERESHFKALPGLIQKYYVRRNEPGHYAGIYVWDSEESMHAFRQTDLAASIPEAYEIVEPPKVETLDMLFKLRD
ncbi:MAG: antibiotic biosynthesis monooxygenase [Lutimonas sp.]